VVDGDSVQATPAQLDGAVVTARVVGATRGPKIDGFVYKPKSNNRRRYGHRQDLSVIEIVGITPAGATTKKK
jgi:large subunit ribosomal protein L21